MYMMTVKVVFFGDNVPKDRADKAIEAAKECDAFLVLGSSVMTMSAYRLVRCIPLFSFSSQEYVIFPISLPQVTQVESFS